MPDTNRQRIGETNANCIVARRIPWNPRAEEHSSPIHEDFHKEVIAAAEADAQAILEEDQVLMTIQQDRDDHEAKATRIFNCLMDLDEKVRQEEIPEFSSPNSTPSTQE